MTDQDLFHESLVPPCLSFFLSLTLFFRLIPWSTKALCIHFPAWASKTWTGRRSASSLPRETGRAPAAYVNRASPLSWGFIGSLCKPRNISLFLASIFLSATFFLYLSLNLFTDAVTLRRPWIQLGQDAGMVVWAFFGIAFLWDWNENWPFPVLWPLLSFRNLLTYWVQPFHSIMF